MDDAYRRSLRRWLPAAGIAVPFLLAVAAHISGPHARPVAAAAPRPALAFDQYLIDKGMIPPSEEAFAYFDFTNRGRAPVEIIQLVPSCGCLQPQLKKKLYQAGESGFFVVH